MPPRPTRPPAFRCEPPSSSPNRAEGRNPRYLREISPPSVGPRVRAPALVLASTGLKKSSILDDADGTRVRKADGNYREVPREEVLRLPCRLRACGDRHCCGGLRRRR